ncbi:MAG: nucleotidyl transferase AbiEii/AbiGii toxin family protein [Chloroflexi bacterium]|nr:nucleotidyl transferase AbiEii/AbiGii toxin family protein [Chloroflexota bacterium]
MSKLKRRVLTPTAKELFAVLRDSPRIKDFFLAGGTALALQLGHRSSVDFDFFSPTNAVLDDWRQIVITDLEAEGKVEIQSQNDGTLLLRFENVPMSFFRYPYPFIAPPIVEGNVRIAAMLDIGLMKMAAIIGRGRKRDFVDLFFIAQQISLDELFQHSAEKFPNVRDFALQAARALVYFADAEADPMPRMFQPVQWNRVKRFFEREVARISKGWVGI